MDRYNNRLDIGKEGNKCWDTEQKTLTGMCHRK